MSRACTSATVTPSPPRIKKPAFHWFGAMALTRARLRGPASLKLPTTLMCRRVTFRPHTMRQLGQTSTVLGAELTKVEPSPSMTRSVRLTTSMAFCWWYTIPGGNCTVDAFGQAAMAAAIAATLSAGATGHAFLGTVLVVAVEEELVEGGNAPSSS